MATVEKRRYLVSCSKHVRQVVHSMNGRIREIEIPKVFRVQKIDE